MYVHQHFEYSNETSHYSGIDIQLTGHFLLSAPCFDRPAPFVCSKAPEPEMVFGFCQSVHYAAIESNRELNKSLKVIALLLLSFGLNILILFFPGVKP